MKLLFTQVTTSNGTGSAEAIGRLEAMIKA
jgi:hypothetical protein